MDLDRNKPVTPAEEAPDPAAERKACIEQLKPLLKQEHTELAQAALWLRMCELTEAEKGADAFEIGGYLSSAIAQLRSPSLPHDAAFYAACRDAAPVFEHFGRKEEAIEMRRYGALL